MARPPTPSDYDTADDSFDAEVFFGPLTDREARLARRLMKRRTEVFLPANRTRPSLEEFRLNNNYLSSKKDDFEDSLEENFSKNDDSSNSDSGCESKPCMDTDVEACQNIPSAVGDSFCTVSTAYFSATSEVDHHVSHLDDSLNNDGLVSSASASYYSTAAYTSEACISYLEDSLNDTGRISSESRIERANDSLEVLSRRQSSNPRDSIIRSLMLCVNDGDEAGEVVYESSFEQDSATEGIRDRQMECLDLKDDDGDLKMEGQVEVTKCNNQPDISQNDPVLPDPPISPELPVVSTGSEDLPPSPNSNNVTDGECDRLSIDSDSVLPAQPASPDISQNSNLALAPNLIGEQCDRLSSGSCSVMPAPPTVPESSIESSVSEESDREESIMTERDQVIKNEFLLFQNSFAIPVKNEPIDKLLPSPLMSSCIPRHSELAEESDVENHNASNLLIPTDTNLSPLNTSLENFPIPAQCYYESRNPEKLSSPKNDIHDVPLRVLSRNECCETTELSAQSQHTDGLEENAFSEFDDVKHHLISVETLGISCALEAENMEIESMNQLQPSDDVSEESETSEHVIKIFPKSLTHNVETQMIVRAISCSQLEELKPDAVEQGCQTSFLGFVIKDPAETVSIKDPAETVSIKDPAETVSIKDPAETVSRGCVELQSWEGKSPLPRAQSSNQEPKPLHKAPNGHPHRDPIFKTPTKPALRIPLPRSGSGSKPTTAPKLSPLQRCSPIILRNRLAPPSKSRFAHITSPIAKYINDSAVPPLISNSKPIIAQSNKLRTMPSTKIPVMISHSGTKKPQSNTVTSASKGILVPSNRSLKTQLPVAKAKNRLEFAYNVSEDSKENSSIEDSILEELKISIKELEEISNKKLKKDILDYVKGRKAMMVNAAKAERSKSDQIGDAPCMSYKGASSLAMKQVDLMTELHTVKNKNVVCSPGQPTILKHTGERKVLHWATGLVTEVDALSSPFHPKIIAPAIYMKTAHKKSMGSVDQDLSTVDVSIVEVVNQARTNTLAKQ